MSAFDSEAYKKKNEAKRLITEAAKLLTGMHDYQGSIEFKESYLDMLVEMSVTLRQLERKI